MRDIVVTVLLTGVMIFVITYTVSRSQVRNQTRREQVATALVEFRRLATDLKNAFIRATDPPEYRLPTDPSRLEQSREVAHKLDHLKGYYEARKSWLSSITRSKLEPLLEDLVNRLIRYQSYLEVNAD
jgi:hypothetical protein